MPRQARLRSGELRRGRLTLTSWPRDQSSLWRASFFAEATQDKSPRQAPATALRLLGTSCAAKNTSIASRLKTIKLKRLFFISIYNKITHDNITFNDLITREKIRKRYVSIRP
jgi:hypothetical protein